jgi:hypothetical protein
LAARLTRVRHCRSAGEASPRREAKTSGKRGCKAAKSASLARGPRIMNGSSANDLSGSARTVTVGLVSREWMPTRYRGDQFFIHQPVEKQTCLIRRRTSDESRINLFAGDQLDELIALRLLERHGDTSGKASRNARMTEGTNG